MVGSRKAGLALAYPLEDGLHLQELSVHEDFQRQGIGRGLLEAVISHAKAKGHAFVSLTTYQDIAWNAPFYSSLGFVRCKKSTIPPALALILEREIDHGACAETRCAMVLSVKSGSRDF